MTQLDNRFYRKQPKPSDDQLKRVVPTQPDDKECKDGLLLKIITAVQSLIKIFGK